MTDEHAKAQPQPAERRSRPSRGTMQMKVSDAHRQVERFPRWVTFVFGLLTMTVGIAAFFGGWRLAAEDKNLFAGVFLAIGGVAFLLGCAFALNGYFFRIASGVADFIDNAWDRARENRSASRNESRGADDAR
jgi:TctA family transporter